MGEDRTALSGKTYGSPSQRKKQRPFIEAVLWLVRTSSPWRDLPAALGNWSTAFRRFRDCREAEIFNCI
jgi:transposase